MKKVWIGTRENRPNSVYVFWRENGKQREKSFPKRRKAWAKKFRTLKEAELNSSLKIFDEAPVRIWEDVKAEYLHRKEVDGLAPSSLYDIRTTIKHIEKMLNPVYTSDFHERSVRLFLESLSSRMRSTATYNKHVRNLKALLRWMDIDIEIKERRYDIKTRKPLTRRQIVRLLWAARKYPGWYEIVFLGLNTGLRREDIMLLEVEDFDFENNSINTLSKKTGKKMLSRPLPPRVSRAIRRYAKGKTGKLFSSVNARKRWDRVRELAGLEAIKFHDLRRQFASDLAKAGVSDAVIQRLLEHADPRTTQSYIDLEDATLRNAIERLS